MYFKFYKWKLMGKMLIFTSDFTWEVSPASDFISENSLKNSDSHKWFHLGRVIGAWQAIRKMSIRNKWNPVGLRKIFIWIFTCDNADIPNNFLYGASLVLHLCKRTGPTGFTRWFTSENFFFLNWRVYLHIHTKVFKLWCQSKKKLMLGMP